MGLIYSGSESAELIQALTANLQSGKEATSQLKAGSQKVVSAVDGKTLSGSAYTAGKGLFSDLIIPTIAKVTTAMDNVETELQTYRSADEHVAGEGLLDEDKLNQQISTKQAMKASVDASASIARALSRSNPVAKVLDALLNVESSLNRMAGDLNDDIRELHQKLEKLHTFSSQTNGLFSNSLNDMKIAMQGVLVLNNTIVNSDGTYQLPSGVDKSWFTEIKKNKQGEFDELKKKINAGDLPTTKAEILRDYHWSTNSNMYVNNKTGLPSPEVTALYNKLVMAEHQPQENPQLAFFNEMLSTGRHPITGEAISKADRLNAQIMIYALALQPFVGAWAMAQVPKSYEPSSVKKTSGVNKKIVEDITNPVLEAPRSGSGLKVDEVKPIKGKGSIYDSDPLTGKTPAKQTQIIIEEFPNVPKAHGFSDIIDNYAGLAEVTDLGNAKLYQIQGSQNGVVGRFEWIIQDGKVTHRMFVRNPELNGVPIK